MMCSMCEKEAKFLCLCKYSVFCTNHVSYHRTLPGYHPYEELNASLSESELEILRIELMNRIAKIKESKIQILKMKQTVIRKLESYCKASFLNLDSKSLYYFRLASLNKFSNSIKKEAEKIINTGMKIKEVYTLFEYLDRLSSLTWRHFEVKKCSDCGLSHKKNENCLKYIKNNQSIELCRSCAQLEQNLLPCGHFYCNKCLKQLIIETWEQKPNSCVLCKFCESKRTVVPLFLLESCFGGSNNYQKKKKVYIDNMKAPNLECKICFNVYKITNFITLECEHRFCSTCLVQFIEDHISSMKTNQIECPDCRAEISNAIVKGNISAGLYEKYLKLNIKGFKLSHNDEEMIWCGFVNLGI